MRKHRRQNRNLHARRARMRRVERTIAVTLEQTLLAISGARGCGKSTLLKWIRRAFGPIVTDMESSGLCDDHIARKTDIGLLLKPFQGERESGGLYPNKLVVQAQLESIKDQLKIRPAKKVIFVCMAGALRDPEQGTLLAAAGYKVCGIHLCARSLREVFEGVKRRQNQGIDRPDDRPANIVNSWEKYETRIVPAMNSLSPGQMIAMFQTERLVDKLGKAFVFIDSLLGTDVGKRFAESDNALRMEVLEYEATHKFNEPVILDAEQEQAISAYEQAHPIHCMVSRTRVMFSANGHSAASQLQAAS